MGKRKELRLEEKVSLVEKCLSGQLRMREAARRTGGGALNHGELDQPVPLRRGAALAESGNRSKRRYNEDVKRRVVENICPARAAAWPLWKSISFSPGSWYWTG